MKTLEKMVNGTENCLEIWEDSQPLRKSKKQTMKCVRFSHKIEMERYINRKLLICLSKRDYRTFTSSLTLKSINAYFNL